MQACRLAVLGSFAFGARDGAALALPTRKDRLLLAYLALSGGVAQDRSRLAGLLWGDRGEVQARDSLRQSLAALRQAFRTAGIDPLGGERDSVTLDAKLIAVDALDFATRTETAPAEALAIYGGDLLEGLDGVTPEYDAWLQPERERLNALAAGALERVAASAGSDTGGAVQFGRRFFARDATREAVARALMRLLAQSGARVDALKVYAACRDALQRDLNVTPDALTEALYRDILTADSPPQPVSAAALSEHAPERPSIAVLPFRNLSNDETLQPLCEVLAEEIITGLGRFQELLVIDRHSSAAAAETTADLAEIGRRLAVGVLVQGSLQRQGETARITVRLVNAVTRGQIWGEAFEQPLSDILALPDRATSAIVSTLHGRVEHSFISDKRPKPNIAAYEYLLRGIKHLRGYGPDDNARAIVLFDQAIALDPDFQLARLYRAFADVVVHGYSASPQHILDAAVAIGARAVEDESDDGRCHFLLGMICGIRGEVEREAQLYRRAMELNPNDANAVAVSGLPIAAMGRPEEGIERFRLAMRLNPYHPEWYWDDLGTIFYLAGRYADAVEVFQRRSRPSAYVVPRLAASLAQMGRMAEAEKARVELLKAQPDFSIGKVGLKGWSPDQAEHLREGMRKAGLPE